MKKKYRFFDPFTGEAPFKDKRLGILRRYNSDRFNGRDMGGYPEGKPFSAMLYKPPDLCFSRNYSLILARTRAKREYTHQRQHTCTQILSLSLTLSLTL